MWIKYFSKQITEKYREKNDLFNDLVNLRKMHDRLNMNELWKVLGEYVVDGIGWDLSIYSVHLF